MDKLGKIRRHNLKERPNIGSAKLESDLLKTNEIIAPQRTAWKLKFRGRFWTFYI